MTSVVFKTHTVRRPAAALTMLTGLLIAGVWVVALAMGPAVCPAVFPADPTCFQSGRIAIAALTTVGLAAVAAAGFLVPLRVASRWIGIFADAVVAGAGAAIVALA
ncbi:hypothetical protein [uncultured Microbacterium sp.]|uniref:hypothetical protein n=1 Tax=uncultured Microbacterium sp. TaxID=191216 RepID=UPI0025FB38CE|nr:hypothetical protein [uncultured Microbacterium sp.]